MSPGKDALLAQLDPLIAQGQRLDSSYRIEDFVYLLSNEPEYEFRTFATSARATVSRIAGANSEFYSALPDGLPDRMNSCRVESPVVPLIVGALTALRSAVDAGLLISLENRLRANVYDDFLVQADELLKANYHVAAMVLIGGVLEDHLKKLCLARALTWTGKGSMSAYNDKLRDQRTAYDTSAWRRIQVVGDDRNKAAHGDGANIKPDDVAEHLQYVRRFLADYPV